jgi:RNA polymerase sigma factor (sigma-70 family)
MGDSAELCDLVRRCVERDPIAWGDFVDRFTPLVFGVLRSYQLSRHEREDVAQAAWVRVIQHMHRLKEPERAAGWLVVITRNEALKYLTRDCRLVPMGGMEDFERMSPSVAGAEERALSIVQAQDVASLVDELSTQDQRLLGMLMAEPPYSYDQISRVLDIPRGSIGPMRARCFARLRRKLDDRCESIADAV